MNKWIAEFDLEEGDTMPKHMDLNYMGAKIDFRCRPMWIPVSERLPDDDTEVLITYIYSGHEIVNVAWINNREWYYRNDIMLSDVKVIAWMPLPDPYKTESEET